MTDLEAQIRTLEQWRDAAPDPQQQAMFAKMIADLQSSMPFIPSVTVSGSATVRGPVVGLNTGTIQVFFGAKPPAPGEALLGSYLEALIIDCDQLRLHRLTGKRQTGAEQRTAPALRLENVYTNLTTNGPEIVVHERHWPALRTVKVLRRVKWDQLGSDAVTPHIVRRPRLRYEYDQQSMTGVMTKARRSLGVGDTKSSLEASIQELEQLPDDYVVDLRLQRPELALEAIANNHHLVLLGEPGAGKSTALRYLALRLAQRANGQVLDLPGWHTNDAPVPLICPLGLVASVLAKGDRTADAALWQVLGDQLDGIPPVREGLRDHLQGALNEGGILLLFDGLDELPVGPRIAVSQAIAHLAEQIPRARCVVTCRVLPYRSGTDWQLPWQERTIQPFAFGQVRAFVAAWYAAAAEDAPDLPVEEATERATRLIDELTARPKLWPLIESPLLLTMLTILHLNNNEVPADRVRLYEECVQLLLERWEPVRTPGYERPGLPERIGLPELDIDELRVVVYRLAFQAQVRPPDDDGRGLLDGAAMEKELNGFFQKAGSKSAYETMQLFVKALAEDAGLLQARADDRFAFPHLTFQEYLAACHLADLADLVERAYAHWSGPDSARWHETLLLMAARLRRQGPKSIQRDGLHWLKILSSPKIGKANKTPTQRRRDAILAAQSYAEMDMLRTLEGSMLDLDSEVIDPLRIAIVDALNTAEPTISTQDRIAAAQILGQLGDPRYPVSIDEWNSELQRKNETFGKPQGYFCYVQPGTYQIGGWDDNQPSTEVTLYAYWIARYPVTLAQYQLFIERGGYDTKRWWTKEGWQYKKQNKLMRPWRWNVQTATYVNQPVIGMMWYEAVAFCNWLTEQLAITLPAGYVLRLPTEAEWDAAVAYDLHNNRAMYPWGSKPEPTSDYAIYNSLQLNATAPVGCCPAGAAACGALDLVGNVWEWACSSYDAYPQQAHDGIEDFTPRDYDVPYRAGAYYSDSTNICCEARGRDYPDNINLNIGFRLIAAPALAQ